ncbi:MAG: DUF975 family protein [Anaerovoracaceae bacterium]
MNNIIVRESASELRSIARTALSANWGKVTLGYVIYYLLSTVVSDILGMIFNSDSFTMALPYFDNASTISIVSNLYDIVVAGALSFGLISFFISFFRRKDINPTKIFDGFEVFLKALGLSLMMGLLIFLWSLLFIIPGIIAWYRYSQSFYIMLDNPDMGIMDCINESKRLMNNNKGRLFYLSITFIGWNILAIIPGMFLLSMHGILGYGLSLVASIPTFFVAVYLITAQTAFYELVSGHLIAEPRTSDEGYEQY